MADSERYIRDISLANIPATHERLSWQMPAGQTVHQLVVDWLFDRLYLLVERTDVAATSGHDSRWQVARCTFDGRLLDFVLAIGNVRPTHIDVDPYNGYLNPNRNLILITLLWFKKKC